MINCTDEDIIEVDSDSEPENTQSKFFEDKLPGNTFSKVPLYERFNKEPKKRKLSPHKTAGKTTKQSNITQNADDSVIYISDDLDTSKELPNIEQDITSGSSNNFLNISLTPAESHENCDESVIFTSEVSPVPVKKKRKTNTLQFQNKSLNVENTKRLVVIDGSNVALSAGSKIYSIERIQICMEYFEKLGHEVITVIPQFRMKMSKSSNPTLLRKLKDAGKILLTPCKQLSKKTFSSYDDRFILRIAVENDAVIISNDNYNDLVEESTEFKSIIESRVIGFTWFKNSVMFPDDPYGQHGPKLTQILNKHKSH